MKRCFKPLVLLTIVLLLAACSSSKKPAEEAIKAAEAALSGVKAEAMKFIPDKVKGVEDALKAAKANFEKKEYEAALNQAKDLPAKVKDLAAAAQAKKAELTKAWEEISGELPKMVEAIKSKVDALSKSKKLPASLDKAKFDGAKAGLDEMTQMWGDAQKASAAGNLSDAMSKANTVKGKALEIMNTLGMQAPGAAKKS
jgi:hypothetical protein